MGSEGVAVVAGGVFTTEMREAVEDRAEIVWQG